MQEMSRKHRTDPTRYENTNKLHSKVGRRHQANSNRIAQLRTAMYADFSTKATVSLLTQAQ